MASGPCGCMPAKTFCARSRSRCTISLPERATTRDAKGTVRLLIIDIVSMFCWWGCCGKEERCGCVENGEGGRGGGLYICLGRMACGGPWKGQKLERSRHLRRDRTRPGRSNRAGVEEDSLNWAHHSSNPHRTQLRITFGSRIRSHFHRRNGCIIGRRHAAAEDKARQAQESPSRPRDASCEQRKTEQKS